MNPENRRHWTRLVLSCPDLTPSHKNVLLALETYADYRTGGNAHPGIERLAADCDLGERAVRYALERARTHEPDCPPDCSAHLGLIHRTRAANSRVGRAAVYQLTLPAEASTTGTPMPVNNPSTGTPMPVNESTTGTLIHHDRHAHDTTTGTHVPPTLQVPSKDLTVESDWGTSPEQPLIADTHSDRPPSEFCDLHPHGYRGSCGACGNARTFKREWLAQRAARDVAIAQAEDQARKARRKLIEACQRAGGQCDDFGRLPDLSPCTHPNVPRIENAS